MPPAARVAKPLRQKHLESWLPQRFNPRASGQITAAFLLDFCIYFLREPLLKGVKTIYYLVNDSKRLCYE